MTAYEQGFITKCAEYGVDPEWLLKMAGPATELLNLAARTTRAVAKNKGARKAVAKGVSRVAGGGGKRVAKNVAKNVSKMRSAQPAASGITKVVPTANDIAMARANGMMGRGDSLLMYESPTLKSIAEKAKARGPAPVPGAGVANAKNVQSAGSGIKKIVPTSQDIAMARANGMMGRGDILLMYESPTLKSIAEKAKARRAAAGVRSRVTPGAGRVAPPVRGVSRAASTPAGGVAGYGALPSAPSAPSASIPTPSAIPPSSAIPTPEAASAPTGLGGKWSRFMELLGGGNANARAITDGRRRAKVLRKWLSDGSSISEAGSAGHARLAGRASRRLGETNAEIARRLQNGGDEELRKVLAARLGVGGLGVLGTAGVASAAMPDNDFTPQYAEPWRQFGIS